MASSTSGSNERNARAQAGRLGHKRRTLKKITTNREDIAWVRERITKAIIRDDMNEVGYARTRLARLLEIQQELAARLRKYQ